MPVLPLMQMLAAADVISLHARLMPETRGMIDAPAIEAMRQGAGVFVNTARGELVNEAALIAALQCGYSWRGTGHLHGRTAARPTRRRVGMTNVVLSPHVAGQTKAAVLQVGLTAAQAILDELAGKRPDFVVNPDAYAARSARS